MQVNGRLVRPYAVSAVLAVLLTAPALAQPGHSGTLANIRIPNFGSVSASYYRGAQPKGHDYADLKAIGVKTIVDFQRDGDPAEPGIVQGLGMQFVRIAMTTRVTPTADQVAQFLAIVNDPANQPVFVHCAGGRHRTGVMTALYRMTEEHWDGARAFAEMKKYNFGADYLHPEFKQFVLAYHAPSPSAALAPAAASAATEFAVR
jgi:tyrosine-protein phosphatase SIW14